MISAAIATKGLISGGSVSIATKGGVYWLLVRPEPGGVGRSPRRRQYEYWELQDIREDAKYANDNELMELLAIIELSGILN